jgi:hypothetical protein
MIAIFAVSMVMHAAKPEIEEVGGHDGYYRRQKQRQMYLVPDLFGHQQQYTDGKDHQRQDAVVMLPVTVVQ